MSLLTCVSFATLCLEASHLRLRYRFTFIDVPDRPSPPARGARSVSPGAGTEGRATGAKRAHEWQSLLQVGWEGSIWSLRREKEGLFGSEKPERGMEVT